MFNFLTNKERTQKTRDKNCSSVNTYFCILEDLSLLTSDEEREGGCRFKVGRHDLYIVKKVGGKVEKRGGGFLVKLWMTSIMVPCILPKSSHQRRQQ